MSIRGGSLRGQAPLEDDGQIKLASARVDLASLSIGVGGNLSGSGTVANSITNLGTIDASVTKLDLQGAVTGDGQLHIDNKATLELGGPTAEAAAFEGKRGTLFLDLANDFTGTVGGMAGRDAIELADFAFSSHPSITSVVGTGAAGSTTDVTITDASLTTTISSSKPICQSICGSSQRLHPYVGPFWLCQRWNPIHIGQSPSLRVK